MNQDQKRESTTEEKTRDVDFGKSLYNRGFRYTLPPLNTLDVYARPHLSLRDQHVYPLKNINLFRPSENLNLAKRYGIAVDTEINQFNIIDIQRKTWVVTWLARFAPKFLDPLMRRPFEATDVNLYDSLYTIRVFPVRGRIKIERSILSFLYLAYGLPEFVSWQKNIGHEYESLFLEQDLFDKLVALEDLSVLELKFYNGISPEGVERE